MRTGSWRKSNRRRGDMREAANVPVAEPERLMAGHSPRLRAILAAARGRLGSRNKQLSRIFGDDRQRDVGPLQGPRKARP